MTKQWNTLNYKLDNSRIINNHMLRAYINRFWVDIVNNLEQDKHISFLLKAKFDDNQIKLLLPKIDIDKKSKRKLLSIIIDRIALLSDYYKTVKVDTFIIQYGIRDGKIKNITKNGINHQVFYKNKLPIAYKPEDYGNILVNFENTFTISLGKNTLIHLIKKDDSHFIKYFKKDVLLFEWTDKYLNDNHLVRSIGKSTYHFINGELVLVRSEKVTSPITKSKVNKQLTNRILTMDIETIVNNGKQIPYLLSWFDGFNASSYFICPQDNFADLLKKVMNDICIKRYKNYHIYLHNFSNFDSYFLIKHLTKIGNCKPVIKDGKFISLKFNMSGITVIFKDSYLLLPSSLRNLAKSFNVDQKKSIFPYLFNDVNYIGEVPDIKYFTNITLDEYKNYSDSFKNKLWSFKDESVKYCEIDCISLYQILENFSFLIFNKFKVNITRYPTLPSLSFSIWRTHYLINDKSDLAVHHLDGAVADDIRKSYTGGAVDMYKPLNNLGEKIYCYDVNSLYPFVMKTFKMPVGTPKFFKGDITKIFTTKAFGFFFCKIIAPEGLKHPILQTHVKTKDGLRTVAPLGTWEDMIFSEEMYNAMNYGYKFEIKWGYTFNNDYVFDKCISDLYQLRLEYPKSDPMNYVAKIIMNSLYGRFGMEDSFMNSNIINDSDYKIFEENNKENIHDVIDLDGNFIVQTTKSSNDYSISNINVAIASAITAYARIHMSQFKNNDNYSLFYSDTDSIYVNKQLSSKFISNTELGKLKLECICTKGVFIAPKVYGLMLEDGSKIIKIKGLSKSAINNNNISLELLESLLTRNKVLEFTQNKWYKHIDIGNISIKHQIYAQYILNIILYI